MTSGPREGTGERFHRETKYRRGSLGGGVDWSSRPPPTKRYPGARTVPLPRPGAGPSRSLGEILRIRRSVRRYADGPLRLEELSFLLWATGGVREIEDGFAFRTAPSAGALYPVETYLLASRVEGVPEGIHHYDVAGHALEEVSPGRFGEALSEAALGQEFLAEAQVVFLWTAVFARATWKYRQRAFRYVYLDAGHLAQNLALAAAGMGLGSCPVAAFFDDEVNALLGVDGSGESVLYLSAAGRPG